MRPSVSDLVWLAIAGMLATAPLLLLVTSSPVNDASAHPIALSELAVEIKRSEISSIDIGGTEGVATDRFGTAHAFQVGSQTNLVRALSQFGVTPDELSAVEYTVRDPPGSAWLWQALGVVAPMILLGILVLIAMTASASANTQLLSLTRHRARRFVASTESTRFADVAGVDEAKRELQELVQFLAAPAVFAAVGARCPRGVLLVGPPGTGKTLLARAVAGEACVPFFSTSGSAFVEIVAGVGASRIRDLLDHARRSAPCILFVDEIDAIGRRRGSGPEGVTSECEQALNQLLVEMDGFDSTSNVIVIGATNRADILDPALLRPGRFDRQVVVAPPDRAGRHAILQVHARGKRLDATVDLARLAQVTTGLSGADLANIMNEGAILAARRDRRAIGMTELNEAIERLSFGPESTSRVVPALAKARRAHHEAGRAVTMHYLEHHPPVHKVTIVPHMQRWGFAWCIQSEDRSILTLSELRAELTAALAGPAAERLAFPEIASSDDRDITTATEIAETMVKRYGMGERLGPVALSSTPVRDYSDSTACLVDDEVRSLIDAGYERALGILNAHRGQVERVATALLEQETIEGDQLERLLAVSTPLVAP